MPNGNGYDEFEIISHTTPNDGEINEALKTEFALVVDDFMRPKEMDDLAGLARQVQTLILTRPGTYQDFPNLGIDIKSFQFEHMTYQTISEMRRTIYDQIRMFVPNNSINDVRVFQYRSDVSPYETPVLIIGLDMNSNGRQQNFFISLLQENGDLRSEIIF